MQIILDEDNALRGIRGEVKEIAVGPSHVAVLLKDGRLARLPFSVISDRCGDIIGRNRASYTNWICSVTSLRPGLSVGQSVGWLVGQPVGLS